jgi:hypothetical protein
MKSIARYPTPTGSEDLNKAYGKKCVHEELDNYSKGSLIDYKSVTIICKFFNPVRSPAILREKQC